LFHCRGVEGGTKTFGYPENRQTTHYEEPNKGVLRNECMSLDPLTNSKFGRKKWIPWDLECRWFVMEHGLNKG
jgi:hypothetical protein